MKSENDFVFQKYWNKLWIIIYMILNKEFNQFRKENKKWIQSSLIKV
jgi:hypothetical protein